MKAYGKYWTVFYAVFVFFLIVWETSFAQQTFTYEGKVESITTGAFARGTITVKGKGEVMTFAVGRKTAYVPSRHPGLGEKVKITYSFIKGENAAYQVEILTNPPSKK